MTTDQQNRRFDSAPISISLTDLSKRYGRTPAVHKVNLDVRRGELFGFLGPNGAGKTTTIKMMTGLLEPTEGQVMICGVDMWQDPLRAKRHLAYIPDKPNLYGKLTGWEYLRFMGSVFQMSQETFEQNAVYYLQYFQLAEHAHDLLETYSHGMKQKMALCGALIHDPDVIMLDEPTVGLDPESARKLKRLLQDLCEAGTTVFMSTHILEIAEHMCDRVGIISDGTLLEVGTMSALRAKGSSSEASLEDIFIALTGGGEQVEVIKKLTEKEEQEQ